MGDERQPVLSANSHCNSWCDSAFCSIQNMSNASFPHHPWTLEHISFSSWPAHDFMPTPAPWKPDAMTLGNFSRVTEFILLGLSDTRELQIFFFAFFFLAYAMVLLGNLLIIVTVKADPKLSSPMYFLLCNLSFIDICCTSVTSPRMLVDLISQRKTIAFEDCIAQLFFLHFVGATEMFLLTVMAYDRYTAICKPLHYTAIMSRQVCWVLVFACWAGGFLHSIVQTLLTIQLPFCGPNAIDNYFCDVPPVIRLACMDVHVTEWLMVSNSGLISLACFLVLVTSYTFILVTVRVRFTEGHWKALSTCASHLMVVTLFFIPCIFIYLRPFTSFSSDKHVCVIYTVFCPVMNPLIYTLRNNEVKASMWKLWQRCRFFWDKLAVQKTWCYLPTDQWQIRIWEQCWNSSCRAVSKTQRMFSSSSGIYLTLVSSE